ncbi:transcription factor bHLH95-like [Amaranthus tricolor]|uniref:transcription factor bHLH95-like n=1 Tax=Amaranthus tricolor TaxID=29722 RepID=UPI00258DEB0F|nr:transcription factor bHLH95-like [Amaranthus tricolor]
MSQEGKEAMGKKSNHEKHKMTERERRKKMNCLYSNLHSLLPNPPPKANKTMIIDEAVNYILTQKTTLKNLQKQKLDKFLGGLALLSTRETFMADQAANNNSAGSHDAFSVSASDHLPVGMKTWTSSNVVLNICGNDAQFSVYAPKKAGQFTAICGVLDKYKLKETYVNISSEVNRYVYIIQANVAKEGFQNQFSAESIEEVSKQAATEIMSLISY